MRVQCIQALASLASAMPRTRIAQELRSCAAPCRVVGEATVRDDAQADINIGAAGEPTNAAPSKHTRAADPTAIIDTSMLTDSLWQQKADRAELEVLLTYHSNTKRCLTLLKGKRARDPKPCVIHALINDCRIRLVLIF